MSPQERYKKFEGVVYHVLKNYFSGRIDEDRIQDGKMYLWEICLESGIQDKVFFSYAKQALIHRFLYDIKKENREKRGSDTCILSYDELLEENGSVGEGVGAIESNSFFMVDFVNKQPEIKRKIVYMKAAGYNYDEIGAEVGYSKGWITNLIKQVGEDWIKYSA